MPHCNGEKFKLGHYRDSCRQLPPYRDVRRPPPIFCATGPMTLPARRSPAIG